MSALIQLLQRGGLLVGGALVIGLLNLVYDGEQWAKSGATPLFSMMLRYLVPLLAGIWLIVLVWQLVKGWRYLERVRRANAGCRENPVIYRILPRADTTSAVSDAMMFWNQVSDMPIVLVAFTSDIVLDGYVQALKKLGRESVRCRYLTKSLSAILDDEKDIGTWADINSRAFDGEWRRVNLFQDHLSKEQA